MIISQILVIAYWFAKIFINAINHNKSLSDAKPIKYNVWSAIVTIIIEATVLYYGKFWDCLLDKM